MYSAWLANLTPEQKDAIKQHHSQWSKSAKSADSAWRRRRLTMSLNVWCFTGRLGRNAETRYLPAGTQVLEFSVAVDVGYGDKKLRSGQKCTLFGERGGRLAQYLTKGTQVAVSGEVNLREWQDRDGGKRSTLEVRVDKVEMIGKRDDAGPRQSRRNEIQQSRKPKVLTMMTSLLRK